MQEFILLVKVKSFLCQIKASVSYNHVSYLRYFNCFSPAASAFLFWNGCPMEGNCVLFNNLHRETVLGCRMFSSPVSLFQYKHVCLSRKEGWTFLFWRKLWISLFLCTETTTAFKQPGALGSHPVLEGKHCFHKALQ